MRWRVKTFWKELLAFLDCCTALYLLNMVLNKTLLNRIYLIRGWRLLNVSGFKDKNEDPILIRPTQFRLSKKRFRSSTKPELSFLLVWHPRNTLVTKSVDQIIWRNLHAKCSGGRLERRHNFSEYIYLNKSDRKCRSVVGLHHTRAWPIFNKCILLRKSLFFD